MDFIERNSNRATTIIDYYYLSPNTRYRHYQYNNGGCCFVTSLSRQRIVNRKGDDFLLKKLYTHPQSFTTTSQLSAAALPFALLQTPQKLLKEISSITPWYNSGSSVFITPTNVASFLLGGLFFSVIIPRIFLFAWVLFQRIKRRREAVSNNNKVIQWRKQRQSRKNVNDDMRGRRHKVNRNKLEVIQYVANHLATRSIQTQLNTALDEAVSKITNPNIRSIQVEDFKVNTVPVLYKGYYYDNNVDTNNNTNNNNSTEEAMMSFDVDIAWDNAISSVLTITTKRLGLVIPVTIQNVRFFGTIRVILAPLTSTPPGFGAIVLSLPTLPKVLDLDIEIAGGQQVTSVPWLKTELLRAVEQLLEREFLWPQRIVQPSFFPNTNATILEETELVELETKDPFLPAQEKQQWRTSSKKLREPITTPGPSKEEYDGRNGTSPALKDLLDSILNPIIQDEDVNVQSENDDDDDDDDEPKHDDKSENDNDKSLEDGLQFGKIGEMAQSMQDLVHDKMENVVKQMNDAKSMEDFFGKKL